MRTLPRDFTFCTGERCDKKNHCLRFLNLKAMRNKELVSDKQISVAAFADHDGKCEDHYIENSLPEEIENVMSEL